MYSEVMTRTNIQTAERNTAELLVMRNC